MFISYQKVGFGESWVPRSADQAPGEDEWLLVLFYVAESIDKSVSQLVEGSSL